MRIVLATINATIGDLAGNAALMAAAVQHAKDARADLVVFPELALCGYPPRDLLTQQGFVSACAAHAEAFGRAHSAGLTLVFGVAMPEEVSFARRAVLGGGATAAPSRPSAAVSPNPIAAPLPPLSNSLLAFRDGVRIARYDKRLLPTYDVFDEDRYFTPGSAPVVIDVPSRGGAVRVGLSICEDLWKGDDAGFAARYARAGDPVAELVQHGAQLILSASASPFVLGKAGRHRDILARHARTHGVPVLSVNQLGGNDELVFDGHRFVFDVDGSLAHAGELFQGEPLSVDVHADSNAGVRLASVPGNATELHATSRASSRAEMRDLWDALVLGTRDYLRKTGFSRALIGLSGGIDSALTCTIAAAAIGPANVQGVSMPGPYSSEHSKGDAFTLADNLGVSCISVPIASTFEAFSRSANMAFQTLHQPALGEKLPDLTEENLQSRIRGTILMTLSNRTGAIVLTTGNKSETAVGYATLYGDMNGGLSVLSDVSKMDVYKLSRWINASCAALGFSRPPIPASSISKPPSAELRPNQTDQDSLPPYEVLDRIIDMYVEQKLSPSTIEQALEREAFTNSTTVRRVVRMIDLAEYKRRQAAIGIKVTSVAFGSGRRFPIAQRWKWE